MGHLTGAGCKLLHLHFRDGTRTSQRTIPYLADMVPALSAVFHAGGMECEIRRTAAVVRVHARRYLGILGRLRRKAMLCVGMGHVAQTGDALRLRSRPYDVVPDQPIGMLDVLAFLPLAATGAEAVGHAFGRPP